MKPSYFPPGGDMYFHDINSPLNGLVRMFFQNIGGLPNEDSVIAGVLQAVNKFKALYCGFQETKVNATNFDRVNKVKATAKNVLGTKSTLHSNASTVFHLPLQPGGLATLLKHPFLSKTNSVHSEPTLLIQVTTTHNNEIKVKIFNVYLPPANKRNTSSYTQATNPIRGLKLQKVTTDVREYFYYRLESNILEASVNIYLVIIGGTSMMFIM